MNSLFLLDRANGKAMGVCAGLARTTGIDVTILRIAAVLGLFVAAPLTILLYLVAGLVAPDA
jgi:phage shock protein C